MKNDFIGLLKLFKSAYPKGITKELLEEAKSRPIVESWGEKMSKISDSLPVLKNGKYKVKFLRDVSGIYNIVYGLKDEVKIVENRFNDMTQRSMGGPFFEGFINIDNGMSPADWLIPGEDVEIIEFIG